MNKLQCADAKRLDLVDFLASLGHEPQRITHHDYWYRSPFRQERTASFKVNRPKNVWYDHGIDQGGDLIDFGTRYFDCSVSALLARLSSQAPMALRVAGEKENKPVPRVQVVGVHSLEDRQLLDYLRSRAIPVPIARQHCREVDFCLHDRSYTAIGFPNQSGGFELRSPTFKGSSAPKDFSFIGFAKQELTVFEGFFDFLSHRAMHPGRPLQNALVLNSLAFLQKARPVMEQHPTVNLYLDNDTAGRAHTQQALQWNPDKYVDQSHRYRNHSDLNQWLTENNGQEKPTRKRGLRL